MFNEDGELRQDPLMAVLAGKLRAWRSDCAPAAGKSTLNRRKGPGGESLTQREQSGHDPRPSP